MASSKKKKKKKQEKKKKERKNRKAGTHRKRRFRNPPSELVTPMKKSEILGYDDRRVFKKIEVACKPIKGSAAHFVTRLVQNLDLKMLDLARATENSRGKEEEEEGEKKHS